MISREKRKNKNISWLKELRMCDDEVNKCKRYKRGNWVSLKNGTICRCTKDKN